MSSFLYLLDNFVFIMIPQLIEEGYMQKKRQRSSLLFGGAKFIKFLAALAILPKDDFEE